jgi:hypothetical protein
MRQRTLDILDKDLSDKNNYYLSLPDEVRFRFLREEFLLDRTYWDKYFPLINRYSYNWEEFKYSSINTPNAIDTLISTNDIGLYIFYVRSENLFLDMPKYVFYVGISGEKGSNRPLKDRLKDYFNIGNIKKRKKVHRMLAMYHSSVYIKFSLMSINHSQLEELEENLHGFFSPICNDRDFPIEMKNTRKAF